MSLARLPKNVWIIALAQPLAMSTAPMMVLIGGLLAAKLAPDTKWATLPFATFIVGTAATSIPAAFTMKKIGRKGGAYIGFSFALLGCFSGMQGALNANFWLLVLAAFLFGINSAFAQQFRFAIYESLQDKSDYGIALSTFMVGGIVSAILGPEIGVAGKDLIDSPHGYAGSFALLSIFVVLAMVIFSLFKNPKIETTESHGEARPLPLIVRNPIFILSVLASATSYGVMSFVMTATPINMYELCGFDIGDTKHVIQTHIACMFLPSLFSGWLLKKFGPEKLLIAGSLIYGGMMYLALSGQTFVHFWSSLVLLGIGWNFLFLSGTALLPQSYQPNERFRVQAANDFIVFATQATASLSAGWFLFQYGWNTLVWTCLAPITIVFAFSLRHSLRRKPSVEDSPEIAGRDGLPGRPKH